MKLLKYNHFIRHILQVQEDFVEEESTFIIPEVAQERCLCHSDAQGQAVILEAVILDEPNVRNALTNDDFEIALINANENNFLLQDFANELAKEVIGDILTTPFNHCDTNHDVLFDYSSDLQDKHDSYKADDTVIFAEVTAIETGIILLTVDIKNITVESEY